MKLLYLLICSLLLVVANCASYKIEEGVPKRTTMSLAQCNVVAAEFQGFSCVEIFYGTNRNRERIEPQNIYKPNDRGDIYGILADPLCEPKYRPNVTVSDDKSVMAVDRSVVDQLCHLGSLAVSIPTNRGNAVASGDMTYKTAKTGEELSREDLRKLFALLGEQQLGPNEFSSRVKAELSASNVMPNTAFIFVHGFNVPFRNAAFRTAQIKYDMGFDGPAMFYSWPANGSAADYLNDLEDADLSVDGLSAFLKFAHDELKNESPNTKIHIIAHSMGSRVTARALLNLSRQPNPPQFGELIVAHGDLDSALFKEWTGDYRSLVRGITLYTTSRDEAVLLSTILRNIPEFFGTKKKGKTIDKKPRIGFFRKETTPQVFTFLNENARGFSIDTIDIGAVGKRGFWSYFNPGTWFRKGHDSYAANVRLMSDMKSLFSQETRKSPHERDSAFVAVTECGKAYWIFHPNGKAKRRKIDCLRDLN